MSKVFYTSVATLALFAVLSFVVFFVAADGCETGCQPWLPAGACTSGNTMKLRLVVDASAENQRYELSSNNNASRTQVGFGFCPKVDELQAFSMTTSAAWAAGDIRHQSLSVNESSLSFNLTSSYLRIYGAIGALDTDYVPKATYDSSALIFDPDQTCTDSKGQPGFMVANFFVVNFTFTNGVYNPIRSFPQAVQTGFMPTCDKSDVCQINPSEPCLGNVTGKKNCAVCVSSYSQLAATSTQVFASYYGTDKNGRRLTSGASNPLNFLALSSTGVFNALKDDITNAYGTVKHQVPGEG